MKYVAVFVGLTIAYVILFRRWPHPQPPAHDAQVYTLRQYPAGEQFYDQDAASS